MALKARKRLFAGGKRFDAQKHPRGAGGKFANVPGKGDDAPQGGKASDVTADDVFSWVDRRAAPSRGAAAQRFGRYRDGMTVREMIDAVEGSGGGLPAVGTRQDVLRDLAWAHGKGWVRFDAPGQSPAGIPSSSQLQTPPKVPQPDAWAKQAAQYYAAVRGQNIPGDPGLRKFTELAGNNTSEVLPKAEFDKVQGTILLRGVAHKRMVAEQYDDSNFFGVGVYGNGNYFTGPNDYSQSIGYAHNLQQDGWMYVSKLRASAKVVTSAALTREHSRWTQANGPGTPNHDPELFGFNRDVGRFAAYRGYDAIHVGSPDYWVVLNKRAVVVSKESLPGDFVEQNSGVPKPPDPALVSARNSVQQGMTTYLAQLQSLVQSGSNLDSRAINQLNSYSQQISSYDAQIARSAAGNLLDDVKAHYRQLYGMQI